jgi:hypothetical protein
MKERGKRVDDQGGKIEGEWRGEMGMKDREKDGRGRVCYRNCTGSLLLYSS